MMRVQAIGPTPYHRAICCKRENKTDSKSLKKVRVKEHFLSQLHSPWEEMLMGIYTYCHAHAHT